MIEEFKQDFAKCTLQPSYAIEKYMTTYSVIQGGYVPFILTDNQKKFINNLDSYRFNINKKTRQTGGTSLLAAYVATRLVFPMNLDYPEFFVYCANRLDFSETFIREVKRLLHELPRHRWKLPFESDTIYKDNRKYDFTLLDGSRLKGMSGSADAMRGFTPTHFIMDEAAYIDRGIDIYGAMLTSLGTGGKCTLVSTPNGYDNFFQKVYQKSLEMENNFQITNMHWAFDSRYNKELVWTKKTELVFEPEESYTRKSIQKRFDDGWLATSTWYNQMCQGFNHDENMIGQELDGEFLRG